jgi:hypothetical protein
LGDPKRTLTRGNAQEPNRKQHKNQKHESLGADAPAFAVLCAYFVRFAVPVLFDRNTKQAQISAKEELSTWQTAAAESLVSVPIAN